MTPDLPAPRQVLAVAALGGLLACNAPRSSTRDGERVEWLVIAPHPDDEALIASGVLLRAAQSGERVAVVIVTNGDYDCVHDGLRRERESIAGLAQLGVHEDHVRFLGYPDGALPKLGRTPLARRRLASGRCVEGSTTYGDRGFGRADQHTVRTGRPAQYTHEAVVEDLAAILAELRPVNVVITHPADTHPDHAATYALFRSALDRVPEAPLVHRAMVHNGDCWPTGDAAHEPCPPAAPPAETLATTLPPLTGRLDGYDADERLPVPRACLAPDPARNPKLLAIGAHVTQTRGAPASYLFSFARRDESFFPETYTREGGRWRRDPAEPPAGSLRPPGSPPPAVGHPSPAGSATTTLHLASGERRAAIASLPMSITTRLPRPDDEARGVVRLHVLEDQGGAYELAIDGEREEASVLETHADRPPELVQTWPLPDDLWRRGDETFELALDPRPDEGVMELTLRCRGAVVGVAIDPRPRTGGAGIRVEGLPRHRVQEIVVHGASR